MRHAILATLLISLTAPAFAANEGNTNDSNSNSSTHNSSGGTAKGAAIGAVAGHEMGSGHAVAGAATGAAIGHHEQKKANQNQ
jgi:uncharacterized protein YcfJ